MTALLQLGVHMEIVLQERLQDKCMNIYGIKIELKDRLRDKHMKYLQIEIVLLARLRDKYMTIYKWKSCCRLGCKTNI